MLHEACNVCPFMYMCVYIYIKACMYVYLQIKNVDIASTLDKEKKSNIW